MPPRRVSIADARNHLTELLREAEEGLPVTITRRGRAAAVLLSDAEYERLTSAAAGADFAAWLQRWRERLEPTFDGIGSDEVARWQELP